MTPRPNGPLLRRLLGRFLAEDGVASLEFTLAVPVFLMIFMASFESAMLMTRFVMLERALDMTVRDVRLGILVNPTHDSLKREICSHTVMFSNCDATMLLELRPVSTTTWEPLDNKATCVDRSATIQPVTQFTLGADNEMMLVRACAIFKPMFPMTGLGLNLTTDDNGDYSLVTSSAFVNEPS